MEDPSHVMKAGEAARIAKLRETKKVQKSMEKKQAVQRAFRSRQEPHQTVSDLHDEIHEMSRITTRLRLQRRQLCDEKGAPLKELEAEALHLTQLIQPVGEKQKFTLFSRCGTIRGTTRVW